MCMQMHVFVVSNAIEAAYMSLVLVSFSTFAAVELLVYVVLTALLPLAGTRWSLKVEKRRMMPKGPGTEPYRAS